MIQCRILIPVAVAFLACATHAGADNSDLCTTTLSDDFENGVLDPDFTTTDSCAIISEVGGAIQIQVPAGCTDGGGYRSDNSAIVFCGDIDVRVDIDASGLPGVSGFGARWVNVSVGSATTGATVAGIAYDLRSYIDSCNPYGRYISAWVTDSDNCARSYLQTSATDGRLRITREGTTVSTFIWDDGASNWLLLKTGTGSTDDLQLQFWTSRIGGAEADEQIVRFDNLSIQPYEADTDGDGVPDDVDNCPYVPNPDQAVDLNGDSIACQRPAIDVSQLQFEVTPLQDPNWDSCGILDIEISETDPVSATGYVVGATCNWTSARAVRWDANGVPTILDPVPDHTHPMGFGVNDAGVVVGRVLQFGGRGVRWDLDGTATVIAGAYGSGSAISDTGWIFGGINSQFGRWNPAGDGRIVLEAVGAALDVNDYGFALGSIFRGAGIGTRPLRWNPDGTHVQLDPPTEGAFTVAPGGINNFGEVCGAWGPPLRWDAAGNVTELPPVPGTTPSQGNVIRGIDDYGLIVGHARVPLTGAIWDQQNQPHRLIDLLAPSDVVAVFDVYGIDSNDQYIRIVASVSSPTIPTGVALLTAVVPSANSADLNNDGEVDSGDLNILLSAWGSPCAPQPNCNGADLNNDGGVDSGDLNILLSAWGVAR